MKKILGIALRVGLIFGIGWTLVLFLMQDSMIYMPRGYEDPEVDAFKRSGGELIEFETGEGRQTAFYLRPADGSARPEKVWIVCGGNGARSLDYVDTVRGWHSSWAYVWIDFPGYGLCEGDPTPKTVRANTGGAIDAVAKNLGWDEKQISERFCAFGHSIGSAAVLQAAVDYGMKRAIVVAPFTSMMEMAKAGVGVPFCYVLRHRFDNRRSLELLEMNGAAVTIFHGDRDGIVPVEMSRRLAREFSDIVTYVEVEGGDHNRIVARIAEPLKEAATSRTVEAE